MKKLIPVLLVFAVVYFVSEYRDPGPVTTDAGPAIALSGDAIAFQIAYHALGAAVFPEE